MSKADSENHELSRTRTVIAVTVTTITLSQTVIVDQRLDDIPGDDEFINDRYEINSSDELNIIDR